MTSNNSLFHVQLLSFYMIYFFNAIKNVKKKMETYLGADVDAMVCCFNCCCGCCGDIDRAVEDDLIMAFA